MKHAKQNAKMEKSISQPCIQTNVMLHADFSYQIINFENEFFQEKGYSKNQNRSRILKIDSKMNLYGREGPPGCIENPDHPPELLFRLKKSKTKKINQTSSKKNQVLIINNNQVFQTINFFKS